MKKQTQQSFAAIVRAWRDRRELSRVDAAKRLGVPLRTMENWEYGINTPRGIALDLLIKRLSR